MFWAGLGKRTNESNQKSGRCGEGQLMQVASERDLTISAVDANPVVSPS